MYDFDENNHPNYDGKVVAVLDIETDHIAELQPKYGNHLLVISADAADSLSVQEGVQKAFDCFGAIDIAIHNACICTFNSEPETDLEVYRQVMNVNYYGALRLAKAVLPHMREARKGRLIFTSSAVGVTGFKNISPYASSSQYGISVHLFHPPLTNTKSASGLMIPKEFKADPREVGTGFAKHIWSRKFIIYPSLSTAVSLRFSYRHPLFFGRMLTKMTDKAEQELESKQQ